MYLVVYKQKDIKRKTYQKDGNYIFPYNKLRINIIINLQKQKQRYGGC